MGQNKVLDPELCGGGGGGGGGGELVLALAPEIYVSFLFS